MVALASALEKVSVAEGYYRDLPGEVQRYLMLGQTFEKLPTVLLRARNESKNYEGSRFYQCVLNCEAAVFVYHDAQDGPQSTETVYSEHVADIERAVMVDPQLGGLCDQLELTGSSDFTPDDDQLYGGVIVTWNVTYMHNAKDPSQGRG